MRIEAKSSTRSKTRRLSSPAGYARVELLQHGDAPMIEPGRLIPRFVFADPVGGREGRARREAYE
jgi:hypothetical protein